MRLFVLLLLLLCQTALAQTPARKDAAAQARLLMQAAILQYNEGDYAAAVTGMKAAYRLHPVPQIQYNLALCHERHGAYDEAVVAFTAYLEGLPGADDRAEVEAKLATLREAARKKAEAQRQRQAEPEPAPAAAPAEPAEAKVVFKPIYVYRDPPPKAGRWARYVALGLGGLAVVGLATGVTFGALAVSGRNALAEEDEAFRKSLNDNRGPMAGGTRDLQGLQLCAESGLNPDVVPALIPPSMGGMPSPTEPDPLLQDTANSLCRQRSNALNAIRLNEVAAIVGGSVAAAALVGSVALLIHGRRLDQRQARQLKEAQKKPEVGVAPLFLNRGGGALVAVRF